MGIDACPLEGFDPAKYDELLGLRGTGFSSTVVAAAGYRSAGDWLAPLPKVRYAAKDVVTRV
jgi:nitroreductase